jgi:hypothetical protein
VRNHRCWGITHPFLDKDIDRIGGKYFESGIQRRLRKSMRVHAQVQRAIHALGASILTQRLADRQDVIFIKAAAERGATVPRGAKRHALGGIFRVGMLV